MIATSRRSTLVAAAGAAMALLVRPAVAQAPAAATGPFALPPLPYAPEANEPAIDAQTMLLHHDRHHAAYVANLNAAVRDYPRVAEMRLSEILRKLPELPEGIRTAVRNNAGGHANHSMFWLAMGGKGGAPSGDLAKAVTRDFGSVEEMKTGFTKAGLGVFGSGWVFVTVDKSGKLGLETRANQDTPLMDGKPVLVGNDLWEHAYYLKYQNRRADYLAAWWSVVDWARLERRYKQAMDGMLDI